MVNNDEKRNYNNFHIFITRIAKSINKNINLTIEAKDILNILLKDLTIKYIKNAVELTRYAKKITIDSNTITTLTIMWIDNPDIIEQSHIIWDKYSQNKLKGIKKHKRAGLYLPPSRIFELFKEYRGVKQKIGEPAYIFLTAIIEYIIREILLNAYNIVKSQNKKTITEEFIYLAINSKELKYLQPLFYNTIICGFGYLNN
jgi:histone H3/H4